MTFDSFLQELRRPLYVTLLITEQQKYNSESCVSVSSPDKCNAPPPWRKGIGRGSLPAREDCLNVTFNHIKYRYYVLYKGVVFGKRVSALYQLQNVTFSSLSNS
jgi:hypothetical protein